MLKRLTQTFLISLCLATSAQIANAEDKVWRHGASAVGELKYQKGFAHFNYLNPLPKNTEEILSKFKKIIVCELNNGQFSKVLKINFNKFDFLQFNKIQGLPFGNHELSEKFKQLVK